MRGTPTGTFSRRKLAQVEGAPYKVGDVVSERYEIKDVVGQGPVGVVYRALDREVDVEVALKVVSPRLLQTPDDRKTFSREIRTAKKLAHANHVKIYDEVDEDRTYFTAQFLDGSRSGGSSTCARRRGSSSRCARSAIIGQIAAALEHAAEQTRPHGDMKPDNVIVLPDLLKVTDFGLATGLPRQPFIAAQRGRGADRYLAPEFLTDREIDGRADVFSLGAILGEMVAGVLPDGNTPPLAEKNPQVPHALEQLYRAPQLD
jgi:serine/threonine protein kinase